MITYNFQLQKERQKSSLDFLINHSDLLSPPALGTWETGTGLLASKRWPGGTWGLQTLLSIIHLPTFISRGRVPPTYTACIIPPLIHLHIKRGIVFKRAFHIAMTRWESFLLHMITTSIFRLTLELILFGAMQTTMSWCLSSTVTVCSLQQEFLWPVRMMQLLMSLMKWIAAWKIFAKQWQSKLWNRLLTLFLYTPYSLIPQGENIYFWSHHTYIWPVLAFYLSGINFQTFFE